MRQASFRCHYSWSVSFFQPLWAFCPNKEKKRHDYLRGMWPNGDSFLVLLPFTYIVVFTGPTWVLLFVEKFFLFCLLVIFIFLVWLHRLPLWMDSKPQTWDVFQGKTQTCAVLASPLGPFRMSLYKCEVHTHHCSQVGQHGLAPWPFQLGAHKGPLLFQEKHERIRRLLNVNLCPCWRWAVFSATQTKGESSSLLRGWP